MSRMSERTSVIVEVRGGGVSGWGEAAPLEEPFFNHETPRTVAAVVEDVIVPLIRKARPSDPLALRQIMSPIAGHPFAKAVVEMAFWDWLGKVRGESVTTLLNSLAAVDRRRQGSEEQITWPDIEAHLIAGKSDYTASRRKVEVGISIGVHSSAAELVTKIEESLERGYRRLKFKITPGADRWVVDCALAHGSKVPISVDANHAYTLNNSALFQGMDDLGLLMIEQPLAYDDIYEHSLLQQQLRTPICLDESISHVLGARAALALGSCRIINIKVGRVGGLTEAVLIHNQAEVHDVGVWCGSMLETGIGTAANLAFAALRNIRYPSDIFPWDEYYSCDVLENPIEFSEKGYIAVPEGNGLGIKVCREKLNRLVNASFGWRI